MQSFVYIYIYHVVSGATNWWPLPSLEVWDRHLGCKTPWLLWFDSHSAESPWHPCQCPRTCRSPGATFHLKVNPISPTKVLNHIDSWEVHHVMKWTTLLKSFNSPFTNHERTIFAGFWKKMCASGSSFFTSSLKMKRFSKKTWRNCSWMTCCTKIWWKKRRVIEATSEYVKIMLRPKRQVTLYRRFAGIHDHSKYIKKNILLFSHFKHLFVQLMEEIPNNHLGCIKTL